MWRVCDGHGSKARWVKKITRDDNKAIKKDVYGWTDKEGIMIATKRYKVTMNLEYDFNTSHVDEWQDNGDEELNYIDAKLVQSEIITWLEDVGFRVEVEVIDKDN
jgi:hypothetical protein